MSQPERSSIDLLIRDADWAFVYWEIEAEAVARVKRELGAFGLSSTLELRLYCSDASPASIQCFPVVEWIGSRYLMLGRPGHAHRATIGFANEDEVFAAIARTPWQSSPRSKAAARGNARFAMARRTSPDGIGPLVTEVVGGRTERKRSLPSQKPQRSGQERTSTPSKGARTP